MSFRVFFDDDAWSDYEAIEQFYADQTEAHLIGAVQDDILSTARSIGNFPTLRAVDNQGRRHEVSKRFHFHVWFRVFEEIEQVEVFAILGGRIGDDRRASRLG